MHRPSTEPIGLQLVGAAELVRRALDNALTEAGGSMSMWLIMLSRKGQQHRARPGHSQAGGDAGAAWSDELNRMELAGLVIRKPDPENPQEPGTVLTEAGDALFHRLLRAVVAFDAGLRRGLSDQEIAALGGTLDRLLGNIADQETFKTLVP